MPFKTLPFDELLADSKPLSDPDQAYGEQFIQKAESPMELKKR